METGIGRLVEYGVFICERIEPHLTEFVSEAWDAKLAELQGALDKILIGIALSPAL